MLLWAATLPVSLFAKEWHVGPSRAYTTPAQVSSLVADGDTVSIDASLYANHPQVYFTRNRLLLRGVGGRPRLEAGAALAGNTNGKAIFVISGADCTVENLEFANAAVPDHNGAGIRQEGCDLTVRYCFFNGNEMGILGGAYTNCTVTMSITSLPTTEAPAIPATSTISISAKLIRLFSGTITALMPLQKGTNSRAEPEIISFYTII